MCGRISTTFAIFRQKSGRGFLRFSLSLALFPPFPFFRLSLFSAFPSFPRFFKKQKPLRRREENIYVVVFFKFLLSGKHFVKVFNVSRYCLVYFNTRKILFVWIIVPSICMYTVNLTRNYIIFAFSSISASTLIIIVHCCVWIILLLGFG